MKCRTFRPTVDRLEPRIALSVGDPVPASATPLARTDAYGIQRHQEILSRVSTENDDVVLLGDSMFDYWETIASTVWNQQVVPLGAANFGVVADRTQNLLWRLENGELADHPRVAVVEIGTNNILLDTSDPDTRVSDTVAGIASVISTIHTLSPETKILLMGLFPQGENPDDPLRLMIQQVNEEIAQLADGVGVQFLDISSAFLQPDGTRPPTIYDVHPTPEEYAAWAGAIHCPVQQMLGRPCAPAVQNVELTHRKRNITAIVLSFNEALDAKSAQDTANYVLTRESRPLQNRGLRSTRTPRIVKFKKVAYDPTAHMTTLVPVRPLAPTFRYQLTVNGTTPSGVKDVFGIFLDGLGNGRTGNNYVAAIDPKTMR